MRGRGELYRLPNKGKIAGVCAGIAEYFGYETWLVRIVLFSVGLLSSFGLFIIAYIAAWFILDVRPGSEKGQKIDWKREYHERRERWAKEEEEARNHPEEEAPQFRSHFAERHVDIKSKVWQAGEPPQQAFRDIRGQFKEMEQRLQKMETYVTSPEFTVAREIDKL